MNRIMGEDFVSGPGYNRSTSRPRYFMALAVEISDCCVEQHGKSMDCMPNTWHGFALGLLP
jgi:hypothetical protein